MDRFFAWLFCASLAVLIFVGGALALYYHVPPATYVLEAIEGGEVWVEQYEIGHKEEAENKAREVLQKSRKFSVSWNKTKAWNGYTLLYGHAIKNVELVDMRGALVHTWYIQPDLLWPEIPFLLIPRRVRAEVRDAYVYPDGSLLAVFHCEGITPYGCGIVKVDRQSKVIWKYVGTAHHDLYIDKGNGDIYGLVHEFMNKAPTGYPAGRFPALMDSIVRLDSEGKEIEKMPLWEAFLDSGYGPAFFYRVEKPSVQWDIMHSNSIMKLESDIAANFPLFQPGQVLISLREPGLLAVVDMKEKKIVWAMKGMWHMQHGARFMRDGSIMLFDNQGKQSLKSSQSRVLIIDPVSGKILWHFNGNTKKSFNSAFSGMAQELDNGNTLISSSLQQNIIEVTRDHEIVWDYQRSSHGTDYLLARRYSKESLPFLTH